MTFSFKHLPVLAAVLLAPRLALAATPSQPALELTGKGVQIYSCTAAAAGAAWKLNAPDAILTDAAGHILGHHFAGPTWQATDGSKVVGTAIAVNASPSKGSVAWLLLRASVVSGNGLFGHVVYVVRTRTMGGVAPARGCDSGHIGAETRIPYSATYTFFSAAP